jgi:hypothetical protein
MSNNQPDVELFEVDADPPPADVQQRGGDDKELLIPNLPESEKRNEIPTELPSDNIEFVKDLPGREDLDEG